MTRKAFRIQPVKPRRRKPASKPAATQGDLFAESDTSERWRALLKLLDHLAGNPEDHEALELARSFASTREVPVSGIDGLLERRRADGNPSG